MNPSPSEDLTSAIIAKAKEDIAPYAESVFKSYQGPISLILMVRLEVEAAMLKLWVAGFTRGLAMGRASVKTEKEP